MRPEPFAPARLDPTAAEMRAQLLKEQRPQPLAILFAFAMYSLTACAIGGAAMLAVYLFVEFILR